jgi:lipopolysaccharide export system protein LptA
VASVIAVGAALALAQGLPTVTVTRGERTIVIAQRTAGSDGARTVLANRNCEEGVLTNVFFGPVAGYVETSFDETVLLSQVAVVRVPREQAEDGPAAPGRGESPDDAADDPADPDATTDAADEAPAAGDPADADAPTGSDDDETVELYGGRVTFDRPGCIAEVDAEDALPVELRQGRTTVLGGRFFLDRGTDVATMDGPVSLTRAPAEGDARPPLEATADQMTFDVERERATLIGSVVVTSGERVSEADRLELDEAAGVALLTGSPAVSRRGPDEVRGNTLRYDLETDEVVAIGAVSATFEVELDD